MKMNRTAMKLTITTLLMANSLCFLHAADTSKLQIGLTDTYDFQAYKNQNNPNTVLPAIFYDSRYFYIDGDELGFYGLNQDHHKLKFNLYYDSSEFKPSDELKTLNKRKPSVMAGGSYTYITQYGGFQVQAEQDILSRSHGAFATFAYLAEVNYGQWTFAPELGIQWNSKKYNNYYYGVSATEAQTSGLKEYHPKQSLQPYLSLDTGYQLNSRWTLYGGLQFTGLSNQQYHSPMVEKHMDISTSLGFLYRF
ncbi:MULTISPECIES: MipA/OmpV family protein [Acinetobacter]|jgi:MipA family protein|uniref:MipA/OmpV family protein n=2 Tax=Acinetobacter pollinis TaxID=2605270 RepID=A0ABU6DU81_9GAMM|nr:MULTISPECIES: MipA/OmpV family protein [Acinetobacter]MBF7690114.1 MipA/OmpV family protein [Acinetobacter pollinis]MBF7693050.1 MipA/OmpV family protein [Acinetobacter pollinis]MBF7697645.1 MipA/OmpV family protein [Acinetobacter pollinis]MBF7699786.1 MipA/OmpV family protein [Acinetobacter pollinis]MEB5476963.1 MipA/OmpV family protein [Acinetobacter pollinis]